MNHAKCQRQIEARVSVKNAESLPKNKRSRQAY